MVPAEGLVPGDVIHMRMGDLVPADVRLEDGSVLLDQSALTGESAPVEAGAGASAYAGTVVKRGEATGEVAATGARTTFGRTAELVRTAKTAGHLQEIIFSIVKYLVAVDAGLVAILLIYSFSTHMLWRDVLPFALMLLVASVPVALPATFTLAAAWGTQELAKRGVLVSRLSAIEEAAAMDVLASDKTGTITQNSLSLAQVRAYAPFTEQDVLRLASFACDEATQDPIDLAILKAAQERGASIDAGARIQFVPFDPATKRSEALVRETAGTIRVVKGAPAVVAAIASGENHLSQDVESFAAEGSRVLAVAAGKDVSLRIAGLLGLLDPPRADSAALVAQLHGLGVRVLMVTGDSMATARAVAAKIGIPDNICTAEFLHAQNETSAAQYDVFAGVLPEDKFQLVRALQRAGHIMGMTGDGVNDAPALKQAEIGIAVASATDVAKAAASIILTNPGLMNVVEAVESSRRIYQRMLTYTLNKIIKTIEIAVFLSVGVMLTHTLVLTPLLIVLLLFTNDFVTMSIATDRVRFSKRPERWHIRALMLTALPLAGFLLLFTFAAFFTARDLAHLPLTELQTMMFVLLVFSGQGTVYLVRERRHLWHSAPSRWLLASSASDMLIVTLLATRGILMAPVSLALIAILAAALCVYLLLMDFFKIYMFKQFGVH